MRITVESDTTVGEHLARIEERYGGAGKLRAYVKENPHDVAARVALHDLAEYRGERPDKRILETREIILPESDLGELTLRRLRLLLTLSTLGEAASVRSLAQALRRDVKNVSLDVNALRELGLLRVEEGGPGRASRVRLPGHRIDLHLVEPKPGVSA